MDKISRTVDKLLGKTGGIPFSRVCEDVSYLDIVTIIVLIGAALYVVLLLLRIAGLQRLWWPASKVSEVRLWRLSHVGSFVLTVLFYIWVKAETSGMTRVMGVLRKLPEARAEKVMIVGNPDECMTAIAIGAFRTLPGEQEGAMYFAAFLALMTVWIACVGLMMFLGYVLTWACLPGRREP